MVYSSQKKRNNSHEGHVADRGLHSWHECKLGLIHEADVAGGLTESKSTSGGMLCIFGDHVFVSFSWAFKKRTAVSHSSTDAEVILLDIGLRMGGLLGLMMQDIVSDVLELLSLEQGSTLRVNSNPKHPLCVFHQTRHDSSNRGHSVFFLVNFVVLCRPKIGAVAPIISRRLLGAHASYLKLQILFLRFAHRFFGFRSFFFFDICKQQRNRPSQAALAEQT